MAKTRWAKALRRGSWNVTYLKKEGRAAQRRLRLRAGGKIPIGVSHMPVAQIRGEFGQVGFDIQTLPIPSLEGLTSKPMPQVMEPRATGVGSGTQTDFAGGEDEPVAYRKIGQPRAPFGEKKAGTLGLGAELIAPLSLRLELGLGGVMNGNQPRRVELGPTHREEPVVQIHIGAVQADGLTHAHAGNGQQPEQGRVTDRPQILGVGQWPQGLEATVNLGVTVKVRGLSQRAVRQKFLGRNLGAGIGSTDVWGKTAHPAQPLGPLRRLAIGGLSGPGQTQLKSQGMPQSPILFPMGTERFHAAPPGQG
jgi:hypothetical protein